MIYKCVRKLLKKNSCKKPGCGTWKTEEPELTFHENWIKNSPECTSVGRVKIIRYMGEYEHIE